MFCLLAWPPRFPVSWFVSFAFFGFCFSLLLLMLKFRGKTGENAVGKAFRFSRIPFPNKAGQCNCNRAIVADSYVLDTDDGFRSLDVYLVLLCLPAFRVHQ